MRRGIRHSGEKAGERFRASDSQIRAVKDFRGWRETIQLGTWVRYLYRQPLIPSGHVGRRMFVGWRLAPVSGRRFRNRIILGGHE